MSSGRRPSRLSALSEGGPMPGDNKAVARTVAVIALLLLAVVALRGHLPGDEPVPEPGEQAPRGQGSVVATFVLFGVSITIIAIGIVAQLRRRSRLPTAGELSYDYRGGRTRVPWRLMLIASILLVAWLVMVLLLTRWGSEFVPDAVSTTDPESGVLPDGGETDSAPTGEGETDTVLPEPLGDGGELFGYLGVATIVLFALLIIAALTGKRRAGTPTPVLAAEDKPGAPAAGADLVRATELGLAEIGDRSRDPREAIIACYAAMERELEKSPGTIPQ
ncbi:MAG: DUF4129 domain-containing protein, partial [Actinomycetia bacterium]|nr:DUF4129 domain-containing protein [Actinomycetes bacterium]